MTLKTNHPMRRWRLAKGHTLKEVADKVGASIAHLSMIERGDKLPSLPLARRIVRVSRGSLQYEDLLHGQQS